MPQPKTKPAPRPVGRPKLHDRAKSSIVPVRFSEDDRRRVEKAATAKGMTVSDWIRTTLEASLNG
jgi:predicted DNA binding CopG/RHH family protein